MVFAPGVRRGYGPPLLAEPWSGDTSARGRQPERKLQYIHITFTFANMPKPFDPKDRLSAMLRAVSDPVRRQILQMLREKGQCSIDKNVGMCASDVEQRLELAQPTVSHHLRMLRRAGLIDSTKIGQWMWFRRNESALRELTKGLRDEL